MAKHKKSSKWIQKMDVKEGALRKYLARKYGLESNQKITDELLDRAEQETDNPTILKRINLARQFKKMAQKKHKKAAASISSVTETVCVPYGVLASVSNKLALAGVKHKYVHAGIAVAAHGFDKRAALNGYLECMLWSTQDVENEDDNLDDSYDINDVSPKAVKQSLKDILNFKAYCEKAASQELAEYLKEFGASQFGHDFWLSRNGHGAGFFDRGRGYKLLQKAAKTYGGVDPYPNNGKVEV